MNGDITLEALRRCQRALKLYHRSLFLFLLFLMCHIAVISC